MPPNTRAVSSNEDYFEAVDANLECSLCLKLFFEPITTACGHTFCRECLGRSVDHASHCPLCRTALHLDPDTHPVTVAIQNACERLFPAHYEARKAEVECERLHDPLVDDRPGEATSESSDQEEPEEIIDSSENHSVANSNRRRSRRRRNIRLPLFLLDAVVFPGQRFPMHIFEPRYRLMLRRIMAGSRRFGLISVHQQRSIRERGDEQSETLPRRQSVLADVGTILEVTRCERLGDGRSLVETIGRERFRVSHQHTFHLDGYLVGTVELMDGGFEAVSDDEDTEYIERRGADRTRQQMVNTLLQDAFRMADQILRVGFGSTSLRQTLSSGTLIMQTLEQYDAPEIITRGIERSSVLEGEQRRLSLPSETILGSSMEVPRSPNENDSSTNYYEYTYNSVKTLSFWLAALTTADNHKRQDLLEMTSCVRRIQSVMQSIHDRRLDQRCSII